MRSYRTSGTFAIRSTLQIVALLFVVGIATMASVGVVGATTSVPPATYAAAVCGVFATTYSKSVIVDASLTPATQAFKNQPSKETATQLRQAFVDDLQQSRALFGEELTAIRRAGVPSGKNGVWFASALVRNLQAIFAAYAPIIHQLSAVDVTSSARFSTGLKNVIARFKAVADASKKQARREPAFELAPAALHRIVVFLRESDNTCPAN